MHDKWKPLVGPTITLGGIFAAAFMWVGSLSKDVEALKDTAAVVKQDHDAVVRMSTDIIYIKEALARIENAVGAKNKEAKR